jgi:hypothetical protein
MTFHFPPSVVDDMGWRDFLAFAGQIDEDARQMARQQAQRRLEADG